MKKKQLIYCECEGKKEFLGEVDSTGSVKIMRFNKAYTWVIGIKFAIYCGKCGKQVYKKEK